jgi:hypothetical protein
MLLVTLAVVDLLEFLNEQLETSSLDSSLEAGDWLSNLSCWKRI